MIPGALVDIVITDYDGVDPTDADNANLRVKYLGFLQHVYNYVWSVREWEWTYKESAVIADIGDYTLPLPTDFQSIGSQGSLFDDARRIRMSPKPRWMVERLRREGSMSGVGTPIFAIWSSFIQLPYIVPIGAAFTLFHRFAPEALVDGAEAEEMLIPDRYARTVLLPGLLFRTQEKKQDSRKTWSEQFNAGLAQMASEENPSKHEGVRMPLAVRGAW